MKHILNEIEKNKIIELYLTGISNKDLSEKFNVHRTTIQRLLKKNKIKLHKRKTKIFYDKDFFNQYNIESCYWAGFILADGYIRKDYKNLHIKLQSCDIEHLKKFLKCLKINSIDSQKIIKIRDNYVSLDLFGKELIHGLLNKFSITNKKSLTAFIDNKIPAHLLSHFIRGYFDGDGSISNSRNYPTISFTGTVETLNKIIDFIIKNEIKTDHKAKICIRNNKSIGSFIYQGYPFLKKFYNIIYKDSYYNIELNRKRDKILYYLQNQ